MADLRGKSLDETRQDVITKGAGGTFEDGHGVAYFDPADKAPLSAINNDEEFYEKGGTWTPVITQSTGPPTLTYTSQIGKYTRIGDVIVAEGDISWSSYTEGTSGVLQRITLPFVANSTSAQGGGVSIGLISNIAHTGVRAQFVGAVTDGENNWGLRDIGDGVAYSNVRSDQMPSDGRITFTAVFIRQSS